MSATGKRVAPLVLSGWPVIVWQYVETKDGWKKQPLIKEHHGANRKTADRDTVKSWCKRYPDANPGIVLPEDRVNGRVMIGFDIDAHGDDDGWLAMEAFEAEFGPVPDDVRIFHGYDESGAPSRYGTRLVWVPEKLAEEFRPRKVAGNLANVTGLPGVDIITPWLRFQAGPGSVHKSGEVYEWASGGTVLASTPSPDDVPVLGVKAAKALLGRRKRARKPEKPVEGAEPRRDVPTREKPVEGAEKVLSAKDRAAELLDLTRQLAALPEGETLLIRGEQRGWQAGGGGFFPLACALVRLAKNREGAKRRFLEAVEKGNSERTDGNEYLDAEREWENAEAEVDLEVEEALAEAGDGAQPYPCAIGVEPYRFMGELIQREFTNEDGDLTLRFRNDDRSFWLWNEKKRVYTFLTGDEIEAIIAKLLDGAVETSNDGEVRPVKVKSRTYAEAVSVLTKLTLTSEHGAGALLPSIGGVPFRNGWLDVKTGELLPITPARDIRWNVQADYAPDATCPEWEAFLLTLGWAEGSPEYVLLRQWMGYLLSGSKRFEKALLMLGPSRAGKGTILRVCHALLGDGAVGTTLDSLMRNFGLQNFIGKAAATIGDARFGRSDKGLNAQLLSLTSNDPLPVDVKYAKPLSINLPVRLMIATNETPNFIEASDALAKRFVALVFEKSFADAPDHDLFERLKKELPGIAKWSLEGLRDLEERDAFSETVKGRALQESMIQQSSFVRIFVEECCVLDPNMKVTNDDLFAEFDLWRQKNGMPEKNSVRFSRELLDSYPGRIRNGSLKVGKKTVRGKFGVGLA